MIAPLKRGSLSPAATSVTGTREAGHEERCGSPPNEGGRPSGRSYSDTRQTGRVPSDAARQERSHASSICADSVGAGFGVVSSDRRAGSELYLRPEMQRRQCARQFLRKSTQGNLGHSRLRQPGLLRQHGGSGRHAGVCRRVSGHGQQHLRIGAPAGSERALVDGRRGQADRPTDQRDGGQHEQPLEVVLPLSGGRTEGRHEDGRSAPIPGSTACVRISSGPSLPRP
jgi:hypothetical protein